jgi:hypothetical protein
MNARDRDLNRLLSAIAAEAGARLVAKQTYDFVLETIRLKRQPDQPIEIRRSTNSSKAGE